MNTYLLTYYCGGAFTAKIVSMQELTTILGTATLTNSQGFRAYLITPAGIAPMKLEGHVTAMVVSIYDGAGKPVDSMKYKE